jgi:cell division septal protein FtsQ
MMRRAIIGLLLVLVVAFAAWVGAPKVLRRIAFFRIHQVEVVGNRYLGEQDVVRRLGLAADASIFDPLNKVRAAAAGIPGTVGRLASVERRFPGTLRVKIAEIRPIALAAVNDQLALLDNRGRVLPFDPARAPVSLPLAEPDSTTAALLDRLRQVDARGYADVESARPDHGDILLDLGGHSIRVRPNADTETLRSIAAVRSWLEANNRKWAEIDARYEGRVFVRKAKA